MNNERLVPVNKVAQAYAFCRKFTHFAEFCSDYELFLYLRLTYLPLLFKLLEAEVTVQSLSGASKLRVGITGLAVEPLVRECVSEILVYILYICMYVCFYIYI